MITSSTDNDSNLYLISINVCVCLSVIYERFNQENSMRYGIGFFGIVPTEL